MKNILINLILVYPVSYAKGEIMNEESEFLKVSQTSAFVDKSFLLKSVFKEEPRLLITAPRGFGKSTNLDMMKNFFSIPLDTNVEIRIRKIFEGLHIYRNESNFFNTHFGKYPVVFVDFEAKDNIRSYGDAFDRYRFSVHKSYAEYEYLYHSPNLTETERNECKNWSDDYKTMTEDAATYGLLHLVFYLKKHFNKNVIVLVDEYDSVINSVLFKIGNNSVLHDIISLTTNILSTFLKDNENIARAIVTGVSYISGCGLSKINDIERYRFLDDHPLLDFYGLTKEEVDLLFNNKIFRLKPEEIKKARKLYNGYVCKTGRRIYNTLSVIKFLQTGNARYYWNLSDYSRSLLNMLRFPEIEIKIESLLSGNSIDVRCHDKINEGHVLLLNDLYLQSNKNLRPNSNLLFSHLFELGFLTYKKNKASVDVDTVFVKLPNKEASSIIFKQFKKHYIRKFNLTFDLETRSYSKFKKFLELPTEL